jgi:hypothetical protein
MRPQRAASNSPLATLDAAVQARDAATTLAARQAAESAMTAAHDSLLKQLRNPKGATPDWDRYPFGRDAFTQRDPWVRVR